MKCVIIKSYNPVREPITKKHIVEILDEYIYTYYLVDDNFDMECLEKYCYTSDDDQYVPSKVFQFYKGEHWILNCVDVDTTKNTWKKELKASYPKLII
jgi:hypothetical protein